jgi:hypothetical protein
LSRAWRNNGADIGEWVRICLSPCRIVAQFLASIGVNAAGTRRNPGVTVQVFHFVTTVPECNVTVLVAVDSDFCQIIMESLG